MFWYLLLASVIAILLISLFGCEGGYRRTQRDLLVVESFDKSEGLCIYYIRRTNYGDLLTIDDSCGKYIVGDILNK